MVTYLNWYILWAECVRQDTRKRRQPTFLCSFLRTCLSVSSHRASSSCCFLRASATALASALRALAVTALEFSPWNFFGIPTAALQLPINLTGIQNTHINQIYIPTITLDMAQWYTQPHYWQRFTGSLKAFTKQFFVFQHYGDSWRARTPDLFQLFSDTKWTRFTWNHHFNRGIVNKESRVQNRPTDKSLQFCFANES